jgi:hypothetical protein
MSQSCWHRGEQLDAHTQRVITQYGQSINGYLERINAGFRITSPTHTYRGGPPSTSYQILINQNAVDLGDAATPADKPSFKNTLSAGDRSTLAATEPIEVFWFSPLNPRNDAHTRSSPRLSRSWNWRTGGTSRVSWVMRMPFGIAVWPAARHTAHWRALSRRDGERA